MKITSPKVLCLSSIDLAQACHGQGVGGLCRAPRVPCFFVFTASGSRGFCRSVGVSPESMAQKREVLCTPVPIAIHRSTVAAEARPLGPWAPASSPLPSGVSPEAGGLHGPGGVHATVDTALPPAPSLHCE